MLHIAPGLKRALELGQTSRGQLNLGVILSDFSSEQAWAEGALQSAPLGSARAASPWPLVLVASVRPGAE